MVTLNVHFQNKSLFFWKCPNSQTVKDAIDEMLPTANVWLFALKFNSKNKSEENRSKELILEKLNAYSTNKHGYVASEFQSISNHILLEMGIDLTLVNKEVDNSFGLWWMGKELRKSMSFTECIGTNEKTILMVKLSNVLHFNLDSNYRCRA
eukprot:NODE_66_length_23959_cov_0.323009.p12 type:complete len:152 gc:universal NODE_66_length_23959_cov_0.323009:18535-18990(+)